jgi:hypothetical protein
MRRCTVLYYPQLNSQWSSYLNIRAACRDPGEMFVTAFFGTACGGAFLTSNVSTLDLDGAAEKNRASKTKPT